MELKEFETLFHLCVAFNFIYSAFENFSKNLGLFFSEPFKNFGKKTLSKFSITIQQLKDKKIIRDASVNTTLHEERIDKNFIDLNTSVRRIFSPEDYDGEYGSKFKSIYLLVGFYSIFIIVICGLFHYCDEHRLYQCLFLTDSLLFIIICYVLYSTFRPNMNNISAIWILLFFIGIVSCFIMLYKYGHSVLEKVKLPSQPWIISLTITIVLLPFFLHFIRVLIQVLYIQGFLAIIRIRYKNNFNEIENKLNEIEYAQELMRQYGISDNKKEP